MLGKSSHFPKIIFGTNPFSFLGARKKTNRSVARTYVRIGGRTVKKSFGMKNELGLGPLQHRS